MKLKHKMNQETNYGLWLQSIFDYTGITVFETRGDIVVDVTASYLLPILRFLKDNTNGQFKTLVDISSVDYPNREKRFEVNYLLLSVKYARRIRVKVMIDSLEGLPSVTGLFSSANWYEREVWDMFGIYFHQHPDLRRLLTDYGFVGHPLRKDFPLVGFTEVRYDEEKKRVVCENLEVSQETRAYDFQSPWNLACDQKFLSFKNSINK